jgi:hypothetical protein
MIVLIGTYYEFILVVDHRYFGFGSFYEKILIR